MAKLAALRHQGHIVIMSLLLFTLAGCSRSLTTREKFTLAGGGIGAATGAALGAAIAAPATGAAIGGTLGGAGGALIGDRIQAQNSKFEAQQHERKRQRIEANHPLLYKSQRKPDRERQPQQTEQIGTQKSPSS
jgi:hypothetical protein